MDIHPRFQAGINIEEIRREGVDFLAVKVSEGLDGSYLTAGSADFLSRGGAAGLLRLGYHYLQEGDEDAQARVFAAALSVAEVPGMLDAEALAADGKTPVLTITGIRSFLAACRRLGARVPLLYLPRWYWDRLGRPTLAGLPPLWASSYVSAASAPASVMYQSHDPAGWDFYGALGVEVLQFTDRAQVAGQLIDADHYLGTREQFAALIGLSYDVGGDAQAGLASPGSLRSGGDGVGDDVVGVLPSLLVERSAAGDDDQPWLPAAGEHLGRQVRLDEAAQRGNHVGARPVIGAQHDWVTRAQFAEMKQGTRAVHRGVDVAVDDDCALPAAGPRSALPPAQHVGIGGHGQATPRQRADRDNRRIHP